MIVHIQESEYYNFAVVLGETPPDKEPIAILKTKAANEALHYAYEWASAKANSSVYAANAKVYIEAIEMNRQSLNEGHSDKADYVQLIYILSNLTYWRGVNSKESRKALKDYSESISGGS
tara:strand:+ start:46 stop:405 length:360 start_codon:yes stop_codon:yes gene_type:complete